MLPVGYEGGSSHLQGCLVAPRWPQALAGDACSGAIDGAIVEGNAVGNKGVGGRPCCRDSAIEWSLDVGSVGS